MRLLWWVLGLLWWSQALGQTPNLTRVAVVVVDTVGQPLEAAVIMAGSSHEPALEALVSDSSGRACCLPPPGLLDSLVIQHISFGAVSVLPPYTMVGDSLLLVVIAGRSVMLPSATVLGRYSGIQIRGDTIRFDAQRFADGREQDVADLLRQLPGVNVDNDGKVTYLGKTVERMLLNGQDVLRSQFSALNALIGSAEIKTAEIITEKVKVSADQTHTLNIVTAGGKPLRADLQLGLSTHGDGIATATVLYVPERGWQLFGTAGYDGTGGSAISSSDEQRAFDWSLIEARLNMSLGLYKSFVFGVGNQNVQAAERNHYALQGSATKTYGDCKTTFFGRYIRADEIERGREDVFNARTSALLGSLRRKKDVTTESAQLSFAHSDTSIAKLELELYGGLMLTAQLFTSEGVSTFDSVATGVGLQQPFAFRQNLPQPGAYVTGLATYTFSDKWSARTTLDLQGTRELAERRFRDSYQLFDLAEVQQLPDDAFALATDTRRQSVASTVDVRAMYGDSIWQVPLIVQYVQRDWQERLNSSPNTVLELSNELEQQDDTYAVAAEPHFSIGKLSGGASLGVSQINFRRGGLGGSLAPVVRESRVAPLLSLQLSYQFMEALYFSLHGKRGISGYAVDNYWTTVSSEDTRTITRGYSAVTPFSRTSQLRSYISYQDEKSGISGSFSFDFSIEDTTLSYLPDAKADYVIYNPTLSYDELSRGANMYFLITKKKFRVYVGGNLTKSKSTIDPLNPTQYDQVSAWFSLNLYYKVKKWLHVRSGSMYEISQQTTQPRGGAAASTSLNFYQPRIEVTLRGKTLSAGVDGSVRFGRQVPTLPVLGGRVTYKHPKRPATVELRVGDILNYNTSTFRSLDLSPGNLRATTYERIPGFVALVARYTLGRTELE